jgi:hypothetical protein
LEEGEKAAAGAVEGGAGVYEAGPEGVVYEAAAPVDGGFDAGAGFDASGAAAGGASWDESGAGGQWGEAAGAAGVPEGQWAAAPVGQY